MPPDAASLIALPLDQCTPAQVAGLRKLNVSARQAVLGKSFPESIEDWQAAAKGEALGLGFFCAGQPVGLVMFKRPPLSPEWVTPGAASMHGLKIAMPWQGRGLGHRAFDLDVRQLKLSWPDVKKLVLAVDAENTGALAIYRREGMQEPGPVRQQGPNGLEHRLEMRLEP